MHFYCNKKNWGRWNDVVKKLLEKWIFRLVTLLFLSKFLTHSCSLKFTINEHTNKKEKQVSWLSYALSLENCNSFLEHRGRGNQFFLNDDDNFIDTGIGSARLTFVLTSCL